MSANSIQRTHIHPVFRRVLFSSLIISGAILFASIIWFYSRMDRSLGQAVAEVSVAVMSILILALVGVGIRMGLKIDRLIRRGAMEEYSIYQSFSLVQKLISGLGYEEVATETEPISDDCQRAKEILAQIEKPRRRGRCPTHSRDKWTKVVLAWENLDRDRFPLTLSEFLCEQFGEYDDGSPRMSENSFYENRKKVISELRNSIAKPQFSDS